MTGSVIVILLIGNVCWWRHGRCWPHHDLSTTELWVTQDSFSSTNQSVSPSHTVHCCCWLHSASPAAVQCRHNVRLSLYSIPTLYTITIIVTITITIIVTVTITITVKMREFYGKMFFKSTKIYLLEATIVLIFSIIVCEILKIYLWIYFLFSILLLDLILQQNIILMNFDICKLIDYCFTSCSTSRPG